jgi:hypothetical protein
VVSPLGVLAFTLLKSNAHSTLDYLRQTYRGEDTDTSPAALINFAQNAVLQYLITWHRGEQGLDFESFVIACLALSMFTDDINPDHVHGTVMSTLLDKIVVTRYPDAAEYIATVRQDVPEIGAYLKELAVSRSDSNSSVVIH